MITRIRKLLLTGDLPAYKVAAEIGIHPSTLSQYALGRREVLPHHLIRLCRYYQLNPEDILGYLDEDDIVTWLSSNEKSTLERTHP